MRVVFAGTPAFALPALKALLAARGVELAGVFTQPPRPAGRGRAPRASAVAEFLAESNNAPSVKIFQPEHFNADAQNELRQLRPDLLVVVAYGLLLPAAALAIPKLGGVNVHASLLPRWRGAAPAERAIEAGDAVSGVSLMQMDAGLDTGAVLARARAPISAEDTGGSLRDKLARAGAALLAGNLAALAKKELPARAQDERAATYARKLQPGEAGIDWRQDAAQLARRVRAFNPWPVAHAELQGARLRVLRAAANGADDKTGAPGEILRADRDGIAVATGDGALLLRELQKPGGKPMPAAALLNGMRITRGMRFSCARA